VWVEPAKRDEIVDSVGEWGGKAELMARHGIAIDDLHAAIAPRLKELQNPDDVHFNGPGNEFLGRQVAQFLAARLLKK